MVVYALDSSLVFAGETFSGPLQMSSVGLLLVDGDQVVLSDIQLPPILAMCSAGEHQWPCGKVAMAALKSFVGNKDVVCTNVGRIDHEAICFVDGKDVALWMLIEGWAISENGVNRPYLTAGSEAANMRRGMWRSQGAMRKIPWNE